MKKEILKEFFEKYIKGTQEKAVVADRKVFLCYLTKAVMDGIGIENKTGGIYITSRCLKHLFDRKPAEEFLFLVDYLHAIVKYPDRIYKNKDTKRGGFCFIKRIGGNEYLGSIEIIKTPPIVFGVSQFAQEQELEEIQVATAFRLRDSDYIKNYTLLWDWGNGSPHRSALDTP